MTEIAIGVTSAVILAVLAWAITHGRAAADRRIVYRWLRTNTRDEPGESHVSTEAVAKGTALPMDRVIAACMSDHRIYRSPHDDKPWSIWRKKPESVYSRRGLIALGDDR